MPEMMAGIMIARAQTLRAHQARDAREERARVRAEREPCRAAVVPVRGGVQRERDRHDLEPRVNRHCPHS